MSWTYGYNPNDNTKDMVRFLIGDTDPTDPLLQDEEIQYLLNQGGAPQNVAVMAIEGIMAKFSRMADETVGGVKINFSQKLKNMDLMKQAMIQRIATTSIKPYAGAISRSDMLQVSQNPDRPCPPFNLHMMQNFNVSPWVSNAWLWGDQPLGGGCGC